jgi:signal transduction histidine kinase
MKLRQWLFRFVRTLLGSLSQEQGSHSVVAMSIEEGPQRSGKPRIAMRLFRLLKAIERGLSHSGATSSRGGDPMATLLKLQSDFVGHHFRLQAAERNLSARARRVRRQDGSAVVRQIELERQRLARELHTGIGQMLAAIKLQLEFISAQRTDLPEVVRDALSRASILTADALEQVRSLSRQMHPPEWQGLALGTALTQLWELSGIPQKYHSSLRVETLPREPELEVKVLLYRAAQEALSNLSRHSKATKVEMSLTAQAANLTLEVRDNGIGFDRDVVLSTSAHIASGIGLRALQNQAEAVGGKLQIQSGMGGTTLVVSAPFSPMHA